MNILLRDRSAWRLTDVAVGGLILALAFTVRIAIAAPRVTPDGILYQRIAENLVTHGCYSASLPASAECVPTWGNQPPGYPFMVVLAQAVGGRTATAIVVVQSLIFSLALAYLLISCRESGHGRGWLITTAVVLAFSPLTVAWSHWVLTETLGAAAAMWVVAECVRSLSRRSFRTGPLSLAAAAGLLTRWDLIWLTMPIAVVAWQLRRTPRIRIRLGTVYAAVLTPIVVLVLRAMAVGLPTVPSALNAGPDELPSGIVRFWNTAAIGQNATAGLLWKVWNREYAAIDTAFDYGSISNRVALPTFTRALQAVGRVPDGQPVPQEIDASFAAMAGELVGTNPALHWATVWAERGIGIWLWGDTIAWSGWLSVNHERYVRPYRIGLLIAVLIAPLLFPRGSTERSLAIGVALFVLGRTIFLVVLNALETRYLAPGIPAMELVAMMIIARVGPARLSGHKGE